MKELQVINIGGKMYDKIDTTTLNKPVICSESEQDRKLLEKCFSFSPNEVLLNYGLEIMGIKKEEKRYNFSIYKNAEETIVVSRCNNNWRKLHGLPVLRGITKFRWECIKQ